VRSILECYKAALARSSQVSSKFLCTMYGPAKLVSTTGFHWPKCLPSLIFTGDDPDVHQNSSARLAFQWRSLNIGAMFSGVHWNLYPSCLQQSYLNWSEQQMWFTEHDQNSRRHSLYINEQQVEVHWILLTFLSYSARSIIFSQGVHWVLLWMSKISVYFHRKSTEIDCKYQNYSRI
jgi:hypothetical protein